MPAFYSRTAGPIATDIRFATAFDPNRASFDEGGNLLSYAGRYTNPGSQANTGYGNVFGDQPLNLPGNLKPLTANEKAIAEAMNFFSTLYSNKDLNASFDEYRQRLNRDPSTGLVSDPLFNIIRERGVASSIEAGRRLGGLRSSGTGRGVADFLTSAEAQQRVYEDERAAGAATNLFNMTFQRGQAGFIPAQTMAGILSTLGGGASYGPSPQFNNAKGQSGAAAGGYLADYFRNRPPTGASGNSAYEGGVPTIA